MTAEFVQWPPVRIIAEGEQRTPEWDTMRRGKVTSSCIDMVCAKGRGGEQSSTRRKYMAKLIAERISMHFSPPGITVSEYVSKAMQQGIEREPRALAAYIWRCGTSVSKVAFVDHPDIPMTGCSPDGFVEIHGLVELKCPEIQTHIDYLLADRVPPEYVPQMQFQMCCCTGRKWNDFVSFCPEMPERGRLFVKRLTRDDYIITALEAEVIKFQSELTRKMELLMERLQ